MRLRGVVGRRLTLLLVLALATGLAVLAPQLRPGFAGPLVVGLGDSVMAGDNCDCDGVVSEYTQALSDRSHKAYQGLDRSVGGATTDDLLTDLSSDAATRRAVAHARVVLISIGANDLYQAAAAYDAGGCAASCYQPQVSAMAARLKLILSFVHELRGSRPQTVMVLNYWNVFLAGDVATDVETPAYIAWSNTLTDAANQAICQQASDAGAVCIDLKAAFADRAGANLTPLLADDGDHPDAMGESVIVDQLLTASSKSGA